MSRSTTKLTKWNVVRQDNNRYLSHDCPSAYNGEYYCYTDPEGLFRCAFCDDVAPKAIQQVAILCKCKGAPWVRKARLRRQAKAMNYAKMYGGDFFDGTTLSTYKGEKK